MSPSEQRTDIAIIGAGPVGLFAVVECGMLEIKCHVVDVLDMIGGQCTTLYPEKPIYDIPAYPKIMARDLIEQLERQAAPFEPVYHLGERVEKLTSAGDGRWIVETSKATRINARAIIIAAGGGVFGPNRPPIPGIEAYEGKSVFYLVKRRTDFQGKRVVIAGGGDSAVDWALSLAGVARRVMVVHRRDKFRAAPDSIAKMKSLADADKLDLVVPYQLSRIDGAEGKLVAVIVTTLDGEERRLEADTLLPFFGLAVSLGPIANWGLEIERNTIPVTPGTCATSTPGIFAIGDIADYPAKLKLILTGFAEAAGVARAVFPLVHPGQVLHFEHSTLKGVPGG